MSDVFTLPTLSTDIDSRYPDRSAGDREHQRDHDVLHALLNQIITAQRFDVNSGIRLLNRQALAPYWDARTKVATERLDVVVVGDSITEGIGTDWNGRLQNRLQNLLRAENPIAGVQGAGWIPASNYAGLVAPFSLIGLPADVATYGLGQKARQLSDTTGVSLTFTGTRVRVWFGWNNDFSTANGTVQIDGGTVQSITATGSPGSGNYWESAALTAGSHTVVVRGTQVWFPFVFEGFEVFGSAQDVTAGVHVHESAHSGYFSSQMSPGAGGAPAVRMWQAIAARKPKLVIIHIGANDWPWHIPGETLLQNVKAMITTAAAAANGAYSILVVVPYTVPRPSSSPLHEWLSIRKALLSLAGGPVAVLDMNAYWPALTAGNPAGVMLESDWPLHPNDVGHAAIASNYMTALLKPVSQTAAELLDQIGQWTAWVPALTNAAATLNVARYTTIGKTVQFYARWTLTAAPTAEMYVGLPVSAHASMPGGAPIGEATMIDSPSNAYYNDALVLRTSGTARVARAGGGGFWNASAPVAWASGDQLIVAGSYERA